MKRLGRVENVMRNPSSAFRRATPEEFAKSHAAAVEAVRVKIKAGKGDPKKQESCAHPFDSLSGDLLRGPCICDDCGKVICDG